MYGLFRFRAQGRENVPASGGCVLACNHLSNFDPWPLGMPLWPNRLLRFMAKSELYWWPQRLVLDAAGAFKVRRGIGDMEAIATAIQIALEADVPLIPAALAGTDRLLRLGPLRVAFGAPIQLDDLDPTDLRRSSSIATERLMAQITALEASL